MPTENNIKYDEDEVRNSTKKKETHAHDDVQAQAAENETTYSASPINGFILNTDSHHDEC